MRTRIRILEAPPFNEQEGKDPKETLENGVDRHRIETLSFKAQQSTVSNVRGITSVRLKTGHWIWQLDLW